jgi:hypothetical protein
MMGKVVSRGLEDDKLDFKVTASYFEFSAFTEFIS